MKILIHSPAFFPSVGGLEFMARTLAEEFTALGHRVTVVTTTMSAVDTRFEFGLVRAPSPMELLRLMRWADVILHMNLSLRGGWPFLLVRRPLIISHQGPYRRPSGQMCLRDRLKYLVAHLATNISCSAGIKRDLPASTIVIGNAYDDSVFKLPSAERKKNLVFVGRFVSDKGLDLLLACLAMLREQGVKPSLTVIGLGPDEGALLQYCRENQLLDQVTFAGKRTGGELADLIAQHRIMIVPSRNEGFGIVALEGIASGCILVGSDAGGLPEAIGECGIVFGNGDVAGLARALIRALTDNALWSKCLAAREGHLARFSRREVARRYIEVIENAVARAESR